MPCLINVLVVLQVKIVPLDAYSACYQLCNRTRGQRGLQRYKTGKNIDAIYQCLKRMQEIYTDIHKYYKHNLLCKYFPHPELFVVI